MDNSYIFITGASSGLGEATAKLLSKQYNVVLNGLTFIYTFSFLVNIFNLFLHRLIYYRDFLNLAIVFWKKNYIFATRF